MAKEQQNEWANASFQVPTQYFTDMLNEPWPESRPVSRMTNPDPTRIYQLRPQGVNPFGMNMPPQPPTQGVGNINNYAYQRDLENYLKFPQDKIAAMKVQLNQLGMGPWTPYTPMPKPLSWNDKELTINKPKTFDGDWLKFKQFMQSMDLYLTINKHIYQNDNQKTAFVLLYMTEKEAAAWKEQFINQYTHRTYLVLLSWVHFKKVLTDSFEPKDWHGDALHKFWHMKQGNKTAEEHIKSFKLFLHEAGLNTAPEHDKIKCFCETLSDALALWILNSENSPDTIQGWYDTAIKFDNNWCWTQNFKNRFQNKGTKSNSDNTPKKTLGSYRPSTSARLATPDPNTMDIDVLQSNKRQRLMKEGKCFNCKTWGHQAKDCPKPKPSPKQQIPLPPPPEKKIFKGKESFTHIKAMIAELPEEEREMFWKTVKEEGFWSSDLR